MLSGAETLADGPVGLVLSKLEGVKSERGGAYVALCPVHDDHKPSLAVATGRDGRAILSCRAGCQVGDVLRAIGLGWTDLFVVGSKPKMFEVARYHYRDENGDLLFDVVRRDPKDFLQQAASGAWKMEGVRRVLYRLANVLEAAALGKRIYVTEGEKDADALVRRGVEATTNVGGAGAGKWHDEYSSVLAGARDVVVLADNDDPGRTHAVRVVASLGRAGITVRMVELPGLPEHGDVSDWLAAGGTADQLEQIADATPVGPPMRAPETSEITSVASIRPAYSLTVVDRSVGLALDTANCRPVDAIPTGFETWNAVCEGGSGLECGWHVVIGGGSGQGKSLLGLNLTVAGLDVGRSVGYVSLEMSTRQLMGRLYPMATGHPSSQLKRGKYYNSATYRSVAAEFDERRRQTGSKLVIVERPHSDISVVIRAAEACVDQGCTLIVVDYLQIVSAKGYDGLEAVKAISGAIRDLAFRRNVVTLALSQFTRAAMAGKDAGPPTIYNLTGGSPLENDADQVVLIDNTTRKDTPGCYTSESVLNVGKNRHGPHVQFRTRWDYRTYRVTEIVQKPVEIGHPDARTEGGVQ